MIVNGLVFWGMFGLFVELCFTSMRELVIKKQWSLVGHTSIWMFPIYALGLSYGFDFVIQLISNDMLRYLTYPLWIWAVELAVGIPTSKREIRLWDYRYLPQWLHWKGIISFAHYPLWIVFGIMVELIKQ
jgi:hypothetical protein|tara:strand:+ start:1496 stop:1885 length:390 start_codon:yes stop_codon:yes gene_type:complete